MVKEGFLKALEFMTDIRKGSRTRKSAEVRLDVAKYLIRGNPNPDEIAKRHGVGKRRVYQVICELKADFGL
jgi:hypothetical protein